MSWFLTILFLTLTFDTNLSKANHDNKKLLHSPIVVGTIYCDPCSHHSLSLSSHLISGASIAIECKIGKTKQRFYKEVKTNEHGEFKVKLPFLVKKHVNKIKGCNFKLLSSNDPNCDIASTSTSFSLNLKKVGFLSFKPTKKPNFCDKKQYSIQTLKKQHSYVKNLKQSKISIFPPLVPNPFQPPPLIPNPLQPPPLIPNPFQPPSPPLIPNPFQPPSPPLIPNPFQPPSPPPFLPNPFQPPPSSPPPLIPNPFQPPPSSPPPFFPFPPPFFPFPPIVIPGLTPSPPPPPPPKAIFPFPFPPLFPPPHSPGSPPPFSP